jgi:hypothetical protein
MEEAEFLRASIISATVRNTVCGALGGKNYQPIPIDSFVPRRGRQDGPQRRTPEELKAKMAHIAAMMKASPPKDDSKPKRRG